MLGAGVSLNHLSSFPGPAHIGTGTLPELCPMNWNGYEREEFAAYQRAPRIVTPSMA